MYFHGIEKDSMLNGDGLRVVLWVSGCNNYCKGCQNPQTWDVTSGKEFDTEAEDELFNCISKPWISGITFSGGDPLYIPNRDSVSRLAWKVKRQYPRKTVWVYTGYLWEDVRGLPIMQYTDVLVDGKFVEDLADVNYPWAGSTNQRVIDVKKSLEQGEVVLWRSK